MGTPAFSSDEDCPKDMGIMPLSFLRNQKVDYDHQTKLGFGKFQKALLMYDTTFMVLFWEVIQSELRGGDYE